MKKLLTQIESTNDRYGLFGKNDRILIALSGGPDSVAMFHLLNMLASTYNLTLSVAHVDHCLRTNSADDRKFCRELCRVYRVKFHSKNINIKALAKRLKIGVEQAGRRCRYEYFQSLCDKYGYSKIATGHTSDDNAETVILNLVRGAGIGGASGIPPGRQNIIRPLIEISKQSLLTFLNANKLSYKLDPSNLESDYNRNIIRNKVFPILETLNAKAVQNIARTAQNIRDGLTVVENTVEKLYEECCIEESNKQITLDLQKLPKYYSSLQSWVLLKAYFRLTGEVKRPDSNRLTQAINLKRRGSVALLGSGVVVANHSGRLILYRPTARIRRINLREGETTKLSRSGLVIRTRLVEKFDLAEITNNDDESIAYLDRAKLGSLVVREPRKGDRFKPLGLKGTKKLVDFLNDKGVPGALKLSVPIVTSDGEIAWVAGYGIAEKFKITDMTKQVMSFKLLVEF